MFFILWIGSKVCEWLDPVLLSISPQGMFIKDSNSLAFYNFVNGATVQLQLKERGGRKK